MLESFTARTFRPLIGEAFTATMGAETMELRLSEVSEPGSGRAGRGSGRTPFSLLFLGPASPVRPQKIYRIEHSSLGIFDLFLVPVGPQDGSMAYEAVFN